MCVETEEMSKSRAHLDSLRGRIMGRLSGFKAGLELTGNSLGARDSFFSVMFSEIGELSDLAEKSLCLHKCSKSCCGPDGAVGETGIPAETNLEAAVAELHRVRLRKPCSEPKCKDEAERFCTICGRLLCVQHTKFLRNGNKACEACRDYTMTHAQPEAPSAPCEPTHSIGSKGVTGPVGHPDPVGEVKACNAPGCTSKNDLLVCFDCGKVFCTLHNIRTTAPDSNPVWRCLPCFITKEGSL